MNYTPGYILLGLAKAKHTISANGVIVASYEPNGKVQTGSFVPDNPSEAELRRRGKWAEEE